MSIYLTIKKYIAIILLVETFISPISSLLLFPNIAQADFNAQINYQGKLTNSSNVAVADGTYHMRFYIYNTTGGATTSNIWTEDRSTALGDRVTVTNGLFSVMLGSSTPFANLDFNQTLYLGIEIGGSSGAPTWDGEMSPRKILGAVPAAFVAKSLVGNATTTNLLALASTTLQNFTATNSTTTNATTTNLFSLNGSFTNLDFTNATGTNATTTNFFSNAGTLTDLNFTSATGTSATTTNFSSTNLFSTNGRFTNLFSDNSTLVNLLVNGSTTLQNFTAQNSTTTNATSTNLYVSGIASTTDFRTNVASVGNLFGNLASFANLLVTGSTTLQSFIGTNYLALGSTTLQDFTASNSTTTNATTTNLFVSGIASTTDLRANTALFGGFVGINSTTPSALLSVGGDGYFTGGLGIGRTNTAAGTLETSGSAGIGADLLVRTILNCNTAASAIQTNGSGKLVCGTVTAIGGTSAGGWTWVTPNKVQLATSTDVVGIGATPSDSIKLAIDSGGIATTTLGLYAVSGQTANILEVNNSSLVLDTVITPTGRLGLGTTSPLTKFSVAGNAYIGGWLMATGTASIAGNTFLGSELFVNSSTTLQNFTFQNATGTSATTTNLSVSGKVNASVIYAPLGSDLELRRAGGSATTGWRIDGNGHLHAAVNGQYISFAQSQYLLSGGTSIFDFRGSSFTSWTGLIGTGALAVGGTPSGLTQGALLVHGSTTLQDFTATNSTTTNATTTNFFATNLVGTNLSVTNEIVTNSTSTNATTTNIYVSGLASTTNLRANTGLFGNVGIGTTSTAELLTAYNVGARARIQVSGGTNQTTGAEFIADRLNTTVGAGMRITTAGNSNTNWWTGIGYNGGGASTKYVIDSNDSIVDGAIFTLDTSGNLGLGSTSPTYKLSVEGSSTLGNEAIAGFFTATSTTATSTFAAPVQATNLNITGSATSTFAGGIRLTNSSGCYALSSGACLGSPGTISPRWSDITDPNGTLSLNMSTFVTNFNWTTGTGVSDLFKLTADAGSNGTGVLALIQTGAGSTIKPFRVIAAGIEAIATDNSGRVGIGTTTPAGKLDILSFSAPPGIGSEATQKGLVRLIDSGGTTSTDGGLEFKSSITGSGYGWRITNPDEVGALNGLYFQTRNSSASWTNAIVFKGNGNVGIGSTSPYARLSVWSPGTSASTKAFEVSNGASTTVFSIFEDGLTSASNLLISGSTTLQAFSGTNYLALGSTTLQNFTFQNATGTSATTTNLFSTNGTFTNLFASTLNLSNLLVNGSTTLQNFTFQNATGTNATTTNLYVSGLASTTNLRANVGDIGFLTAFNALFNSSTTLQNFTFQNATGTNATTTNLFVSGLASTTNLRANIANLGFLNAQALLVNGSTTLQAFTAFQGTIQSATATNLYSGNLLASGSTTLQALTRTTELALGYTTLQDFTATNGTTTNATSTSLFVSGLASTTQIRANTAQFGGFVGVGTMAAERLLHVAASASGALRPTDVDTVIIEESGRSGISIASGNTSYGGVAFSDSGNALAGGIFYDHGTALGTGADSMQLWTAGARRVTIDSVGLVTLPNLLATGSTTLQDFTATNSTTTNATSTNLFVSGLASTTNLRANIANLGFLNAQALLVNGSTTLQAFTAFQGTIQSATATNLYATNFITTGSTTLQNLNFVNATGTNATTTTLGVTTSLYTPLTAGSIPFIGGSGLLSQNNSQLFWDRTNNRLGLGTTTPAGKFDIYSSNGPGVGSEPDAKGTLRILDTNGTTGQDGGLEFKSSITGSGYGWRITNPDEVGAPNALYFQGRSSSASWSNLITFRGSGSVGIGTSSPQSKLAVVGGEITLDNNQALRFSGTSGSADDHQIYADTNNSMIFRVNDSIRALINSSGNFGISTTSPGFKLSVAGSGFFDGGTVTMANLVATSSVITPSLVATNLLVNGSTTLQNFTAQNSTTTNATSTNIYFSNNLTGPGSFIVNSSGNVGIGTHAATSFKLDVRDSQGGALLRVKDSDSAHDGITLLGDVNGGYISNSSAFTSEHIYFQNSTNAIRINTAGSEKARIDSSGNFGLGTTSPIANLDIFKTGDASIGLTSSSTAGVQMAWTIGTDISDSGKFKISSSTLLGLNDRFVIDGSGKVGIGTSSPLYKLEIADTGAPGVSVDGTTNPFFQLTRAGIAKWYAQSTTQYTEYYSNVPHYFSTSNVGIGTTTPLTKLHTYGTSFPYMLVDGNGSTQSFLALRANTTSNTDTQIYFEDSGTFTFDSQDYSNRGTGTGSVSRLAIVGSSGSVGIGTTTPASQGGASNSNKVLEIAGTVNPAIVIHGTGGTGPQETLIFNNNGAGTYFDVSGATTATNNFLAFRTSATNGSYTATEAMRITSSQYVGIGTTSPATSLNVYNGNDSSTLTNFTQSISNAGVLITGDAVAGNYNPGLFWSTQNDNGTKPKAGIWPLITSQGSYLYFGTSNSYATGITNTGVVMDYNGSLGVGTTTPLSRISAIGATGGLPATSGTSPSTSILSLRSSANNGLFMGVDSSAPFGGWLQMSDVTSLGVSYPILLNPRGGSVGVGTTSPSGAQLVVSSSTGPQLSLTDASLTNNAWTFRSLGNFLYVATSSPTSTATSTATAITINPSGNVGINNTNPLQKLHVNGIVSGGNFTATNGSVILVDNYTSGNLTTIGTEYSSGGPVIGYSVTASTTAQGAFVSATPIAANRSAINLADSIKFYTGSAQTVAIGSPVTTSEVMRITQGGSLGVGTSSPSSKLSVSGGAFFDGGTVTMANLVATSSITTPLLNLTNLLVTGSSTLQNFTFQTATGTSATTTNFFSTNLVGTNFTFTNETVTNSTSTNATTTNLYVSGLASTTNLRANTGLFGNVGVGTTTPQSVFSVSGGTSVFDNPGGAIRILKTTGAFSNGDLGIWNRTGSGGDVFAIADWATGINGLFVNTSNGNIGIGTTTPKTTLHVATTSTASNAEVARFTGAYTTAGSGPLLRFTNGYTAGTSPNLGEYNLAGIRAYDYASNWSGALEFQTSDSTAGGGALIPRMTISGGSNSGNVGISTTSPSYKLAVSGSAFFDGGTVRMSALVATSSILTPLVTTTNLLVNSSTTLQDFTATNSTTTNATTTKFALESANPFLYIRNNGASQTGTLAFANQVGVIQGSISNNVGTGEFRLGGMATNFFPTFYSNGSEVMRITAVGNVGIGTTSPAAALHVQGNEILSGTLTVGTTTASVSTKLTLTNSSNSYTGISLESGAGAHGAISVSGGAFQITSGAGATMTVGQTAAQSLDFITNNIIRQRITSDGSIGIATTTPGFKLSVSGSGFFDGGTVTMANLVATSSITTPLINLTNLLVSGSSTLQNFTFQNATGTNATTTNLYVSGLASTTNLRANIANLGFLTAAQAIISGTSTISNLHNSQEYTITLTPGTEEWVKLADISNLGYTTIVGHINSTNNEEPFRINIQTSHVTSNALIDVDRQTYNGRLAEVRVEGADGAAKSIYVKLNTSGFGPTLTWRMMNTRGTPTIYNATTTTPTGSAFATLPITINTSNNTNKTPLFFKGNADAYTTFTASSTAGVSLAWSLGVDLSDSGKFKISSSTALGTSDRLAITGNGYIGLGTSSPTSEVVISTNTGETKLVLDNTSGSLNSTIAFSQASIEKGYISYIGSAFGGNRQNTQELYTVTGVDQTFLAGGTERMRISATSGNTGMGSTSPGFRLSVSGSGFFDGGTVTMANLVATSSITTPLINLTNLLVSGSSTLQNFTFQNATGTNATTTNLYVSGLASTTNLRANTGLFGNVGLGTSSPTNILDIASTNSVSGLTVHGTTVQSDLAPNALYLNSAYGTTNGSSISGVAGILTLNSSANGFSFQVAASPKVTIDSIGNVGIGTTTPSRAQLEISSSTGAQLSLTDASLTNNSWSFRSLGNNLYVATSSPTSNATSSYTALTVYGQNGYVGLGSTTPSAKLAIVGSGTTGAGRAITVADSAGVDRFTVNDNGRVLLNQGFLEMGRVNGAQAGISWYSPAYTAWTEYMSPAGTGSSGPHGNLTTPSGTYVTSWGLRSFIENASGYGWTWEGGTSSGQPSVVAELASLTGNFRTIGSGFFEGTTLQVSNAAPQIQWIDTDNNGDNRIRQVGAETAMDLDYSAEVASTAFGIYLDGTAVASNLALYINSSRNVGFGTATPIASLDVLKAGDASIGLTSSSTAGVQMAWTIGTDISDSGKFKISSSTLLGLNDRFVIDGSGNVGIGTSTPPQKLSVDSATDTYVNINSTNTGGDALVSFTNTGDANQDYVLGRHDDGVFRIARAAGTKFSLDTSDNFFFNGNVGVGTTTPSTKLEVHGADSAFRITSSASTPQLDFYQYGGLAASRNWSFKANNAVGGNLDLYVSSSNSGSATTHVLSASSVGNIGIGSTTPTSPLSVKNTSPQIMLGYDDSNYTRIFTQSAGALVLDPSISTDQIYLGAAGTYFLYGGSNGSNLYALSLNRSGGSLTAPDLFSGNGSNLVLGGSSAAIGTVAINTSGGAAPTAYFTGTKVGIGTSTPNGGQLVIASSTAPQLALVDGSATSDAWTMRALGNYLYIATSSPTSFATSTVAALSISPAGNVAVPLQFSASRINVGTTTPFAGRAFQVDDSAGPVISLIRGTSNANRFEIEADGTNMSIGPRNSGYLSLRAGAFAELARVDSTGLMVFGSTTLQSATTTNLYVSNRASTTDLRANTAMIGNLTVTSCTGCSGGGFAWPFTKLSTNEQSTSTIMAFTGGMLATASSTFTSNVSIMNSGTLGIGSSSPYLANFTVATAGTAMAVSAGDTGIILSTLNSSASGPEQLRISHNLGAVDISNRRAGNMYLQTSGGNVGIGTTSPNATLHAFNNSSNGAAAIFNRGNGVQATNDSGIRIVAPISVTHYNWMLAAQQNIDGGFEITPSTAVGGATFSTPTLVAYRTGTTSVATTLWTGDGNPTLPSLTFSAQPTTGFYRSGSAKIAVSSGSTLQVQDGSITTTGLSFVNDSGMGLWRCSTGVMCITNNSLNVAAFNSKGLVGIGTTTQARAQLEIASSTGAQLSLADASLTSNSWSFRSLGNFLYVATSSPTSNATSTVPSITVSPSNMVGIATSTPSAATLSVHGSIYSSGNIITSGNLLGTLPFNYLTTPLTSPSISMGAFSTLLNWSTGTGVSDLFRLTTDGSSNGTGYLLSAITGASSTVKPLQVRAGSLEAISVDANALVGIGTTSPSHKLTIALSGGPQLALADASLTSNAWTFRSLGNFLYIATSSPTSLATSTYTAMTINPNGFVGFGSSTPGTALVVVGTTTGTGFVPNANLAYGLGNAAQRFKDVWVGTANIGTSTWSISNGNDGRLTFNNAANSAGTETVTLATNGNVGIGVTNPQFTLDVVGNSRFYGGTSAIASSTFTFAPMSSSHVVGNPTPGLTSGAHMVNMGSNTVVAVSTSGIQVGRVNSTEASFYPNNVLANFDSTFTTHTSNASVAIAQLDSTRVVVVSSYLSGSHGAKAMVCTIPSGATFITASMCGTPVIVKTAFSAGTSPGVTVKNIDGTNFLVAVNDPTLSTGAFLYVGVTSGNTISSIGTAAQVSNGSSTSLGNITMLAGTTTRFVYNYVISAIPRAVVGNITGGTTISMGTTVQLQVGAVGIAGALLPLSDSAFITFQTDALFGSVYPINSIVGVITSTSTIATTSAAQLAYTTTQRVPYATYLDATHIAVGYQTKFRILEVSSSTIVSVGAEQSAGSTDIGEIEDIGTTSFILSTNSTALVVGTRSTTTTYAQNVFNTNNKGLIASNNPNAVKVVKLDSNKFATVIDLGTSIKIVIGFRTGDSIVYGPATSISTTTASSFYRIAASAMDSNTLVVAFGTNSTATRGAAWVCPISGVNVTCGTAAEFYSAGAALGAPYVTVAGLDSTHFVVGYASTSAASPTVLVATVSGSTITSYGTAQTAATNKTVGNVAITKISGTSTQFAFGFDDSTTNDVTSGKAKVVVGSIGGGNNITLGTTENFVMATSSTIDLESTQPNTFVATAKLSTVNSVFISFGTITNQTSISTSTQALGGFTAFSNSIRLTPLDSTHLLYQAAKQFRVIEVSASAITNIFSPQTIDTSQLSNFTQFFDVAGADSNNYLVTYSNTTDTVLYGVMMSLDDKAFYYEKKALVIKSSDTTIEGAPLVGIGTPNPLYALHVSVPTTGSVAGFTNSNGYCTIDPTTTSLSCTSDANLKKNISTIASSTDIVRALRGVNFNWKNDESDTKRIGFIAQEVQLVAPELVSSEGGYLSVNYLNFAPLLVNAWNAMDVRLASLEGIATSTLPATSTPMLSVTETGLGIGTLNPDFALHAKFGGNGTAVFENENGVCEINPTTGSFGCAPSNNFAVVASSTIGTSPASSTEIIKKLRGVNLSLMNASTTINQFGFLASDVELVAPELVSNVGGIKLVRTTDMIPLLVNSVNDLALKVESLEERVAKLEANFATTTSATSTSATSTIATGVSSLVTSVLSAFENMGTTIGNQMARFTNVFADQIVVGSTEKPSGITLYDVATRQPYCMRIENGGQVTTRGVCSDILFTSSEGGSQNNPPPTDNGTSTPATGGETGTSTPPTNNEGDTGTADSGEGDQSAQSGDSEQSADSGNEGGEQSADTGEGDQSADSGSADQSADSGTDTTNG